MYACKSEHAHTESMAEKRENRVCGSTRWSHDIIGAKNASLLKNTECDGSSGSTFRSAFLSCYCWCMRVLCVWACTYMYVCNGVTRKTNSTLLGSHGSQYSIVNLTNHHETSAITYIRMLTNRQHHSHTRALVKPIAHIMFADKPIYMVLLVSNPTRS